MKFSVKKNEKYKDKKYCTFRLMNITKEKTVHKVI